MILAMETGGELASLALLDGMDVVGERAFRHRMSLSKDLMPAADELLARAGAGWDDVEAVAVGLGPGSYTGLRIGVVTAKALAWASDRPILGISSLAALAAPHLAPPETLLCAVLEARAGEFFTALYQWRGSELQIRAEPTVLPAPELAERLAAYPGPVLVVGHSARFTQSMERETANDRAQTAEGKGTEEEPLSDAAHPSSLIPRSAPLALTEFNEEPQARWIGRLAAARLRAGERDHPAALVPLYVRPPGVTIKPESKERGADPERNRR
jgi:tRNA threonylcarbamoyladenosine biosynthesis protein TsaB